MKTRVDLESITAEALMSKIDVTASPETTLSDALGKMMKYDVHELPIVKHNKLVGILSYDVLTKRRKLAITTHVEHLMCSPPRIEPHDTLPKIAEILLTNDFRGVPITSRGKLVGVVSRKDIIKVLPKVGEVMSMPVDAVMTPSPVWVRENEGVSRAMHLLRGLDERMLPVTDNNDRLVGMIDIKHLTPVLEAPRRRSRAGEISGERIPCDISVKSVMSTPPVSVSPNARVKDVINLMISNDVSSVVVARDRKPVGIITHLDLIELVARYMERAEVYVQITGLEEQDPSVYDAMYALIQKTMKKISKIATPRLLSLHVVHHHHEYDFTKYTIRGRLNTDRKLFVGKAYDWDLMKALGDLLAHMEVQVRREHERVTGVQRKHFPEKR
jgi:CBS domain-containing protein